MSTLAERLKIALDRSGKTQRALAAYCGITSSAVNLWFNGQTKEITAGNALKAAVFLGVNVDWLATGEGAIDAPAVGVLPQDGEIPDRFIAIPEYNVEFGAGDRAEPSFEEATESKPAIYREDWFIAHHLNPLHCKRLKVHGDSMTPILFDGDSILVDCSPQTVISGKIYAFGFGDSIRVKRLFTKLNGGLRVHSENPTESDEEISPDEMSMFYLVGRVVDRSGSGPF